MQRDVLRAHGDVDVRAFHPYSCTQRAPEEELSEEEAKELEEARKEMTESSGIPLKI